MEQNPPRIDGNLVIASERKAVIEIPNSAVVACPKVDYQLISPLECVDCEFHTGFADRFPGSDKTFAERYLIGCRGKVEMRQVMTVIALVGARQTKA